MAEAAQMVLLRTNLNGSFALSNIVSSRRRLLAPDAAYATSMTSVRPSVCLSLTLVDCDHIEKNKKVKIGT